MKLHRNGVDWNRDERNKTNDNWDKIEGNYNNVVENVSEKAFDKVVDAAKLNWKEPVGTTDDLPTSASEGDTRMTRDTGKIYRFDGSVWQEIQEIDATAINEVDNRLSEQLAQNEQQVAESVQSIAMPENISTTKTKSAKLVLTHPSNNKVNVIQFNGKDYVIYELDNANGTVTNSVGLNWELIRLKKAIRASGAYVAKKNYASTYGTLETLYTPSTRNTIEDFAIYKHPDEVPTKFLSSSGGGLGVGVYSLTHPSKASSVAYDVKIGTNRKCNVLLFGTQTSSDDVDIAVNGEVVKKVDTSAFALGTNLTYKVIEFDIPTRVNIDTTVSVAIRNNNITGKKLYFSCLNFMHLKDYDGRDIDLYKVFTTSQKWIDHGGASDYAIFDKDLQQWCGSYHGGETSISQRMTYSTSNAWNPTTQWDTGRFVLRNKTDVPQGWYIIPSLKIQQLTDINGKGKMLSILDFDTDGTLQMNFSFFEGSINVETFYTALTTTHLDFNMIRYPKYKGLAADGSNEYLQNSEGYVIQNNSVKGISLGQRYTLFGGRYIPNPLKRKGWIRNDPTYYKKLYYGFVEDYSEGVIINNLQFRKAMDFMSE